MLKPLSVYIHIPFCVKKCAYCDFLSYQGFDNSYDAYFEALSHEIDVKAKELGEYEITTIFFGGGTPTVLKPEQLAELLRIIKESFNCAPEIETTIEANPGTVDAAGLSALSLSGFNRISFGLQSNNNRLLSLIGRIHDYQTFERNYNAARKAGFCNINIDIMFALPSQSQIEWENTLDYVIEKNPEHISAYGLILEEGTPLEQSVSNGDLSLPDEETQLNMYHTAIEKLRRAGYEHYEISNFAKHGFHCRHNTVYWRCMEYVGFGLGASSCIDSVRFRNENAIGKYLNSNDLFNKYEVQETDFSNAVSEFMFLGLRMMEGISTLEFQKRFRADISEIYGQTINTLIKGGLLEQNNDMIYLTKRGIDISNYVFSELVL